MKQTLKKKKITVETSGPLRVKGGIRGPIEIPYMEEISTIGRMVVAGYKVTEHLSDGTKIKLTIQNYNKENGDGDLRTVIETVRSAHQIVKNTKVTSTAPKYNPVIDIYLPK